ncbi:MAG: hypothetical protein WBD07_04765 [Vicinamibacterales bacterium]
MRHPVLFTVMAAILLGATGTPASSTSAAGAARQQAFAYLAEPTLIGSTIVQGPVLFTHDEAKMQRGEPCTTVHLVEPGKRSVEVVASFHCIPTRRPVVDKFTMTTEPNAVLGYGCILTEYQFAGDTEAHGVPMPVLVRVGAPSAGGT